MLYYNGNTRGNHTPEQLRGSVADQMHEALARINEVAPRIVRCVEAAEGSLVNDREVAQVRDAVRKAAEALARASGGGSNVGC